MSRSFARFDPRAADAKIWRTSENGKKYQLDDETGEILKGNVGQKPKGEPYQSRPLESTAPDKARFDALVQKYGGNHKKAAREYFREKLQGRHVEAWTSEGPVVAVFTGDSWTELKKDMSEDPVKAALLPYLPDIIATGEYASESPSGKHPDVKRFHTYRKTVQTDAGPKEVIVDVAERPEHKPSQPRHQVYSFTREGTHAYSYRKQKEAALLPGPPGQNRGGQGAPTQDSVAAVDENISPQFEVVNLRIEDVTVDEDTIVANVTARFREWLRAEREARLAQDAAPEGCGRVRPGCFTGPFAGLNRIRPEGKEVGA